MAYSLVSLIAFFVIPAINFDVLFGRSYRPKDPKAFTAYRFLIVAACAFFLFDALWGFLDPLPNKIFAEIDTALYYVSMGVFLLTWLVFVSRYLSQNKVSRVFALIIGSLFFAATLVLATLNFFQPVLYSYKSDAYAPAAARYAFLIAQIAMFGIAAIYALIAAIMKKEQRRSQSGAIIAAGFIMAGFIAGQYFDPMLPLYGAGCFASMAIVHAFVVSAEKERYRISIEAGLRREAKAEAELNAIQEIAYTDPLTGVKSKHSYVEFETEMDKEIREHTVEQFCIMLFDLNDLKLINDTYGHETGDKYIIKSCEIIHHFLPEEDIYRYGGDEFVVVLKGEAYTSRFKILEDFNAYVDANVGTNEPIISAGLSDFIPEQDNTLSVVFARADERMYYRKRALKGQTRKDSHKEQEGPSGDFVSRAALYEAFSHIERFSLLDFLNASNADEILDVDLNEDTYHRVYHVEGKYGVPTVEGSYGDLVEFAARHVVHPEDIGAYMGLMKIDGFAERLENGRIPGFDFAHFRYKLQGGEYRYVEQAVIGGKENGFEPGKYRIYLFDINNLKARQLGSRFGPEGVIAVGRDPMTGLLTGKDFARKATERIKAQPDVDWCLVSIDIEHFKFFSEWFGRKKGDILLASLGAELVERENKLQGVGGYFGQDDFAMLMPLDQHDIEQLFERIRAIIGSFDLTGGLLPAFGVAKIESGLTVMDAFDRASLASSKAKADIASRICYYTRDMQYLAEQEYRVLTAFAAALQNDEITFYLQPQVRISTAAIVGAEALARWVKSDGAIVSPGEFVPVLEKYGFVSDLDKALWEKVCAWIGKRVALGKEIVPISVNVSRVDLFNLDLAQFFHDLCEKYHVPHKLLKIEITESSYATTTEAIDDLVKRLHDDGFMVLMDDFGSGYSSLNMLSNLKLDAIKLDAKFLDVEEKRVTAGAQILESVVNMAKMMALPIVMEGVETKEQTEFLADLGCRYAQGFYFYKPMRVFDFESLLNEKKNIDHRGMVAKINEQFRIREFLDRNIYSDSMLNNILGPVAIYSLSGEHVDIIRYNEQFYQAVNVPDFAERLVNIEQFVPDEDRKTLFGALEKAKENKLLGASGLVRFGRIDGTMSYFEIHFYYLGLREGTDQFYGSARNVTPLLNAVEEQKLVAEFSTDNIIFINRVYDRWVYTVASQGLTRSALGLSAMELQDELNSGRFAERFPSPKGFKLFTKEMASHAEKHEDFGKEITLHGKDHREVPLKLTFTYVNDRVSNVIYVLVFKEA